jgi:hypothetical protein
MSGNKSPETKDHRQVDSNSLRNIGNAPFIPLTAYNWTNNRFSSVAGSTEHGILDMVPKLKLQEFQPEIVFNLGAEATTAIASGLHLIFGKGIKSLQTDVAPGRNGLLGSLSKIGVRVATSSSANTTLDKEGINTEIPTRIYNNLIKGGIVGSYELPYMQDTFVEYNEKGWSQSGLSEVFGEGISKFVENNTPYTSFGVPQWKMQPGGGRLPTVDLTVNLYNNNITNLCNNYTLLHQLSSGAMWLQDGLIKKSPNLYHIECDGRFIMPFSTMTIVVEYGGMRRQLHKDSQALIQGACKSLNPFTDNNTFFPDYYKVTLKCQSLLPNNYNSFIMYGNGIDHELTETFGAVNGADFISNVKNAGEVTGTELVEGAQKVLASGASLVKGLKEGAGGFLNNTFGGLTNFVGL